MTKRSDIPARPTVKEKYRLQHDDRRDEFLLLYPEGAIRLNRSGYEILSRLDGRTSVNELIRDLQEEFDESDLEDQVRGFLSGMVEQGVLTGG